MINMDCLRYICSKFCVFYLGTLRTMLYYSAVSSCTWVRKRGCCLVWGFPMGQQHTYSQGRRNNTASTTGCGTLPLARSTAFRTASALCRKCSVWLMMKMWVFATLFLFLIPTDMLNDQTQINGIGSLPVVGLGLGLIPSHHKFYLEKRKGIIILEPCNRKD